jgi:hypothetical protein
VTAANPGLGTLAYPAAPAITVPGFSGSGSYSSQSDLPLLPTSISPAEAAFIATDPGLGTLAFPAGVFRIVTLPPPISLLPHGLDLTVQANLINYLLLF